MAEVTLELLGEQMTRMFERLSQIEARLAGLEAADARAVTKGDVVALFRGLELKIEAWQDGQEDRFAKLERRVRALEDKLEVR